MRRGVVVVAASSRPLAGIRSLGGPHLDTAIALNGAVAVGPRMTWEAPGIPDGAVAACCDIAERHVVSLNMYTATRWFSRDQGSPRILEEQRRLGVRPAPLSSPVDDAVQKILMLGDQDELSAVEGALREVEGGISWFRSEPTYLEIGRADTSKATGVRIVMDWLKPARTYAIGDGLSDIPMFDVVDVAVAVANAPTVVRDAAGLVVAANDRGGVPAALELIMGGHL